MRPWVVLKFGGTSVATARCWETVAARVGQLVPKRRVWIVASALSGVSNYLEEALRQAAAGEGIAALAPIRDAHVQLARDMGLPEQEFVPIAELFSELERLLEGIRLTREASPRLRARVMSFGELASTYLGAAALAHHGIGCRRLDARDLLTSIQEVGEAEAARFLAARVEPLQDLEAAEQMAQGSEVVITQGFIVRTPRGETALLGRGGSDTSAALFAALLGAEKLEIWTDVHGLFTTDPRQLPAARLIRRISYREAQELAAMGARVLHPRCLGPAAWAAIPIEIRNTADPETEGTRIGPAEDSNAAVMAVVRRTGVTLLSVSTLAMWGAPGFLARVFAPFAELGISVDLVATSQSAVSVTLDEIPEGIEGEPFAALLEKLAALGEVEVVHPSAVVSIVGRRIRTVLHQLGAAFSVFREHEVHLVSESSEDLNLSFVVSEERAPRLLAELHARLLPRQGEEQLFGPSWEVLGATARGQSDQNLQQVSSSKPAVQDNVPAETDLSTHLRWWRERREELLDLCSDGRARYVYEVASVERQAGKLRTMVPAVGKFFYAMKANPHQAILRCLAEQGFGMECVSLAEVQRVRSLLGSEVPILFTPNFCPIEEFEGAFELGAEVTVDGPEVLLQRPDLFAGRELALRVDPGHGMGHHEKVRTAGAHAKFGYPVAEVEAFAVQTRELGVKVVGLHAHVGSGILDPGAWDRTGALLAAVGESFPELRWVDVGGGLGVVERAGQQPLDLQLLNEGLSAVFAQRPGVELRMEPGRYLVSGAGVLLAPVTQVRRKGQVRFVGLATGMNSLLRPALYGSWHDIHNLTRLDSAPAGYWHVVGPICESGDVLGRDRLLPETRPGDVLLIDNCGAYGAVMASRYNLREPAEEQLL